MHRMIPGRTAWLLILLLAAGGCGSKEVVTEVVPIEQVAPNLVEVAQKSLPEVKFTSARKVKVDGEDVYEIRGKMPNGKIREVEVSAAGKVLEIE